MKFVDELNLWLNKAVDDKDITDELNRIKDNETAVYESFYKNLTFGTAGLRGIIGAGTNKMNIYTVRKATQGLANFLKKSGENLSVAISYDSRIKATLFAKEASRVLAANGIKVYITKELAPTPFLSYLVRYYGCNAGIMITASHNPAQYNGYKCYGSDGCQMTDNNAGAVYNEIEKLDIFEDINITDYKKAVSNGMICDVADEVYDEYIKCVLSQSVVKDVCKNVPLKIVYTPLNGAGNKLIRKVLDIIGVKNLITVKEQELPDGNFPTCPYPNPEFREALDLGIKLFEKEDADVLLASDPDSDRLGVVVKSKNGTRILTGNEIGIMLCEYLLKLKKENNTLAPSPVVVKTIVSTILTDKIGEKYNCEVRNVLTGFKYIGEQILNLEKNGEENRFVFGFEESYGYLSGTYVRDKDAVVAAMLVCEMTAYYKNKGLSLNDVVEGIYNNYGQCKNTTVSLNFEGVSGLKKMRALMESLRLTPPEKIADYKVLKIVDYKTSVEKDVLTSSEKAVNLPSSDVLEYRLENENRVIIRPSGTEPKIKVYITALGKNPVEADEITEKLNKSVNELMFS